MRMNLELQDIVLQILVINLTFAKSTSQIIGSDQAGHIKETTAWVQVLMIVLESSTSTFINPF